MEFFLNYQYEISALAARLFLACLFFFQGYDAVVKLGIKQVVSTYEEDFSNKGIPRFLTVSAAWFTSYTEFIGGILLFFGLFEYYILCLLAINLIIAAIGFGINDPVWDTRHVFPRLLLVLFLLMIPPHWNLFSLDHLFF